MIHVNTVSFKKNLVLVTEHQFVHYINSLENVFKDTIFLVSTNLKKNLSKNTQIFFYFFKVWLSTN